MHQTKDVGVPCPEHRCGEYFWSKHRVARHRTQVHGTLSKALRGYECPV